MKIGIPIWNDRISPVLDAAGHLMVVDIEDGRVISREIISIPDLYPLQRARVICQQGLDTLICGAVSRYVESVLRASGIELISWRCGDVDEVISAYCCGRIDGNTFRLPGCGRHRRHRMGSRWKQPNRGPKGGPRFFEE